MARRRWRRKGRSIIGGDKKKEEWHGRYLFVRYEGTELVDVVSFASRLREQVHCRCDVLIEMVEESIREADEGSRLVCDFNVLVGAGRIMNWKDAEEKFRLPGDSATLVFERARMGAPIEHFLMERLEDFDLTEIEVGIDEPEEISKLKENVERVVGRKLNTKFCGDVGSN